MRRRDLLALGAGAVPLAGCGLFGSDEPPPPPPPPTVVSVTMKADPGVNPDQEGTPKPIAVKLFQLGSTAKFLAADFFALDGDAASVLGGDLIAQESYVIPPGGTEVYQREMKPEARFVGITAAYAQIDQAQWRGFYEPAKNQTTLLLAQLGAHGLKLQPVAP
jgi:type VI secretion system protein VasD